MSESERARANSTPEGQSAAQAPGGADPSMEDILASIRRILAEEEGVPPPTPAVAPGADDGVLQLDASMMLADPIAPAEALPPLGSLPLGSLPALEPRSELEPGLELGPLAAALPPDMEAHVPSAPPPSPMQQSPGSLMAPEAAAATATSVGSLLRTLSAERSTQVYSGGPTIEDVVRAELRPLLKQWLDTNLPGMVERLVRVEIERVVGRAVP